MRDRPTAAELIAIARATLATDLLPLLPAEPRVLGLMVARALDIAEREISAGDAPLRSELARLGALYGESVLIVADSEMLGRELSRLNRRLAGDLRAGRFKGDRRVWSHLLEETRARLAESNPKILDEGVAGQATSR